MDRQHMSNMDIGEIVDGLINLDMTGRGVISKLYEAARSETQESLTQLAAAHLKKALEGSECRALILTGFSVNPERVSETDGPIGAAVLARALDRAFKCKSSIVIEEKFFQPMKATLRAAGLHTVDSVEELDRARHAVGLLDFPIQLKEAADRTIQLLDQFKPSVVIAIERCGWNEQHIHHNMRGLDISQYTAKEDLLVEKAKERKILTIGIGDGGNEIGMGRIPQAVKKHVPYGDKCQCPCGLGLGAAVGTDVLVTANVSNWAASGISACLAVSMKNADIIHDRGLEEQMIQACVLSGSIDGVSGYAEPSVDGFPAQTNGSLVDLLRGIAQRRIT